ncbi:MULTISPECIES: M28 family metallopeptidase [unclassified Lentimicrobium]|uniref:M28 family metallopeptidase n=1 Tax=unclassified Lentimicrobium TaxID=2677434 RepID=UPI001555B993|nr:MULTISPECIES: M28 family peptidase [unclassified Lentimicrobium]NPD46645.1 M28 family peptidase [Lentimicrobium sp. S6]NPD84770.1 M28 family peptidase [Lentimicrobium sp. L6]
MKKTAYIFILIVSMSFQLFGQNPLISNVVNLVSGDSIFNNIALLEQMERYTPDNNLECVNHLISSLDNIGMDTIYLQKYTQGWLPNIIAVKYGTLSPDSVYVLGAHYDSYKSGAPAADDNASGTSGVLEATRILSKYKFKKTIMMVLFSGEETGRWGSKAFTDSIVNNNIIILGMINLDMISYVNDGDHISVSICVNKLSLDLMNIYTNAVSVYAPNLKYAVDSTSMIVSAGDHSSFWDKNVPAVMLIDEIDLFSDNFNNHIHSNNDILGLSANSKIEAELITKSAVATIINIVEMDK